MIAELTTQESFGVLARTQLGRLACSKGMQPYVVPFYFAYQGKCLYSFSMPGQKIDWMRANPLVCVEADQMRREHWASVVVFGRYKELRDTEEMQSERALAVALLQKRPEWWKPGIEKIAPCCPTPAAAGAMAPVFYRIDIAKISGRRGGMQSGAPDNPRDSTAY